MEFRIAADELKRALYRAQGIVERKTTMPILSNVLITASKLGIQVEGGDLDAELGRGDQDIGENGHRRLALDDALRPVKGSLELVRSDAEFHGVVPDPSASSCSPGPAGPSTNRADAGQLRMPSVSD